MIKLTNVLTPIDGVSDIKDFLATKLKIQKEKIKSITLFKRSVDARKKPEIFYCDTYLIGLENKVLEEKIIKKFSNAAKYIPNPYIFKKALKKLVHPPIVVGSGPAGLFASLTLCKAGIPPIILEQGQPVDKRIEDVEGFWKGGKLNPYSNVQFGEGGAGTFSDGKLNTGIKDPRCRTVLEVFNHFGADDDILIKAKPHIGTDVLRNVVKNMRTEIESLGGKYYFGTKFIKPKISNGKVLGALCKDENGEFELPTDNIILAIGNAARDTFYKLFESGVEIISKPFAVGVRIEHLQEMINTSQYGENYNRTLPPCEYKLATHLKNGRGVYTFCMCPGGIVVNSASEENTYVTNGMSYKNRALKNANSALLVGVDDKDYAHLSPQTPFGGIVLQQKIERAAFTLTKGNGVPVQTVGSFLKGKCADFKNITPTVKPNAMQCDIREIFPTLISDSIRDALPIFEEKIKGFSSDDAILTAPETRSSSPIRIVRKENYISNISGLYPCGEGAGYAGGITSSAVDGIRTAEKIIESLF